MKDKCNLTWEDVFIRLKKYDILGSKIYGVPKGGMIIAGFLQYAEITHDPAYATLILDDIIDSGKTRAHYHENYPDIPFVALYDKTIDSSLEDKWLIFPWEKDHPAGEDTVQQNIVRMLQFIGEDVTREGLVDTPDRIVKSWQTLYKGYFQKPEDLLTVFDANGYDEIVLLKDVEIYSMCEHHMLPFFGKAHVAYIPDKKIVGISKLARLVDVFARRMQIQERIGDQVTSTIMDLLQAKGAACILECKHMCMLSRGVEKQNSIMTTSSMKGAFLEKPAARQELMQLIKG